MMLVYPDYNQPFAGHMDASNYHLRRVISQQGKPIGFFVRKLTSAQINYTTTQKELLGIVKTLKYYWHMLLATRSLCIHATRTSLTIVLSMQATACRSIICS